MITFILPIRVRPISALVILIAILGWPLANVHGDDQESMRAIEALDAEWQRAMLDAAAARRKTNSPDELDGIRNDFEAKQHVFVEQCLDLAREVPNGRVALIAMKLVACRSPQTEEGKKAAEVFVKRAEVTDLDILATSLDYPTNTSEAPTSPVVPIVLRRIKANPAHPQSARLLASFVCGSADPEAVRPSAEFVEAAEMLATRYADSPDALGLCEMLGWIGESQSWPADFERHLRAILDKNQHRAVRVAASFALATVVATAGERRQGEAEVLYESAIKKFDGSEDYFYAGIEKNLNGRARLKLAELKAIGKPAPEIEGVGLDGRGMKLSDYRGKVVLLSFWATWCGPCMKMIPHELRLARRLEGKPFVIVGVNGDTDRRAAETASAEKGMTWRSFQDKNGQRSISLDWHVWAWPTFYLIDQEGVIRKRFTDAQPEAMERAIDQLFAGQTIKEINK